MGLTAAAGAAHGLDGAPDLGPDAKAAMANADHGRIQEAVPVGDGLECRRTGGCNHGRRVEPGTAAFVGQAASHDASTGAVRGRRGRGERGWS